jgi:hypothetical protein
MNSAFNVLINHEGIIRILLNNKRKERWITMTDKFQPLVEEQVTDKFKPLVEEQATMNFQQEVTPSLQFSVPYLSEGNDERIRSFVGIFYELPFPEFPTPKFSFFLANGWCNGKGKFKQKVRILNPDRKSAITETPDQEFDLKEIQTPFMAVNFFAEMQLPQEGTYWIQTFLNGKLVLEYPMVARKVDIKK